MDTDQGTSDNPFSKLFWCGAFDLRSIGLLRITLGAAILLSVLEWHPFLTAMFSDRGVLPRTLLLSIARPARFSLLDAVGPRWLLEVYWIATAFAAVCFLAGWRTRIANLALFVLLAGLHERNVFGTDGSDCVERLMLFWLLFVPTGGRYSVDALSRATRGLRARTHGSAFVIRLAQLQFCWIYLDNFINKMRGPMWRQGSALHYALGMDHYLTKTLGKLLFHADRFTRIADYGTLVFEGSFILLVLLPWCRGRLRALALLGGVALHAGIFATMSIGDFSIIMVSVYPLLFLPGWIDRAERWLAKPSARGATLVIADSSCRGCWRLWAVLHGCDLRRRLSLVEADELGAQTFMEASRNRNELYTVSPDGDLRQGWFALLEAADRTTVLWPLARLFRLPIMRAFGANWYGRQLLHGGTFTLPAMPAPAQACRLRWPLRLVLSALLASCVWSSLPPRLSSSMPTWIDSTLQFCELWQDWRMFAPDPVHIDNWIKSEGRLADGHRVDPLRDVDGLFPPVELGRVFSRWTKYSDSLRTASKPILLAFGQYVCRRWNDDRPRTRARLKEYKIFVESRPVPAPGHPANAWHEDMLWHHVCY